MWNSDTGIQAQSLFRGITTPVRELYQELENRGWEVQKVDFSDGKYVARAQNPHGDQLEGQGPDDSTAVGNLLLSVLRHETIRVPKFAAWDQNFVNNMEEIAKAYAKAPTYDPKAAAAWKELADDSKRRADVIRQQLKVEVVDDPAPYDSAQEMCEDVHKNKHVFVSRAYSDHPVWTIEQNVDFRLVHDVLGHCSSGGGFDWAGENKACGAHFPLLPPLAQKALFTECIAQTAAGGYFRSFMPQKVVLMDDYMEDSQSAENPANHHGVHPSQTIVPGSMPEVETMDCRWNRQGEVIPHWDGKITMSIGPQIKIPDIVRLFAHELRHIGQFHRGRNIYGYMTWLPLTARESEEDAYWFEEEIAIRLGVT